MRKYYCRPIFTITHSTADFVLYEGLVFIGMVIWRGVCPSSYEIPNDKMLILHSKQWLICGGVIEVVESNTFSIGGPQNPEVHISEFAKQRNLMFPTSQKVPNTKILSQIPFHSVRFQTIGIYKTRLRVMDRGVFHRQFCVISALLNVPLPYLDRLMLEVRRFTTPAIPLFLILKYVFGQITERSQLIFKFRTYGHTLSLFRVSKNGRQMSFILCQTRESSY